jgi:hypothetical protein
MWDVEGTDEFTAWYLALDAQDTVRVDAAVERLAEAGPALGRPLVDTIKTSRHPHMKELRPTASLRILFAFDPRRTAILLLGGDKRGQWSEWYQLMVPRADALYDEHLETLHEEGLL